MSWVTELLTVDPLLYLRMSRKHLLQVVDGLVRLERQRRAFRRVLSGEGAGGGCGERRLQGRKGQRVECLEAVAVRALGAAVASGVCKEATGQRGGCSGQVTSRMLGAAVTSGICEVGRVQRGGC